MAQAVIYCRSSKDRAEVGLPAQLSQLKAFAKSKGLTVAAEFSDMEISGSLDETSRPGLRKLLTALRDPARKWTAILAVDPSRIARDPLLAVAVTVEAEKHKVAIHYANVPADGSSADGALTLGLYREINAYISRISAEKGRKGMEANLAAGFRAGGAAPYGYKLEHQETGGTRGGNAVRKSTLAIDTKAASKVRAFLKSRARGIARNQAAKDAKLQDKAVASLIAIERNALTYAGYTVWNQRKKKKPTRDDPRQTMLRRPRKEWVISDKPTHKAIITGAEAERILALHDTARKRPPRVREPDKFILSGLLFTPDGIQWHGDSHDHAYRAGMKGKRINAAFVEGGVLYQVAMDFADRSFLKRTVAEARRMADGIEADPQALGAEIKRAERRLANLVDMAADTGDKALLAKIRDIEGQLATLREQRAAWADRKALKDKLAAINEDDMGWALAAYGLKLRGDSPDKLAMIGYSDKDKLAPDELRRVLTTLVERIELDAATRKFNIRYRLPVGTPAANAAGVKLASPQGYNGYSGAVLSVSVCGRLSTRAPRGQAACALL